MVGITLALGIDASSVRTLVQGTGIAMRMTAAHFRKELQNSLHLQHQVNLYTYALMSQVAQSAACNRFHVVEARLARWLLMTRDRVGSNSFHLTHKFLGDMLGVRRVGVTEAAYTLKQRKLIDYDRGNITITHRRGLEAVSCSCHGIAGVDESSVEAFQSDRTQKKPGNSKAATGLNTSGPHQGGKMSACVNNPPAAASILFGTQQNI